MSLNIDHFQHLTVTSETVAAPPPYSHTFQLIMQPSADRLQVQYQLTYTERETLSEEDIFEEGFTLADDYAWEGNLPLVWQQAIVKMLQQTTRLTLQPKAVDASVVRLQLQDQAGATHEGIPDNLEAWVYFLQELTQAVFEVSRKEHPLEIHYLEISATNQKLAVSIRPSFSTRQLQVAIEESGKQSHQSPEWKVLKPLLKAIYLPDYDASQANPQPPDKLGQYIDPGEGVWYALGKSVTNPGKKYDAVGAMVKEIKGLISSPVKRVPQKKTLR